MDLELSGQVAVVVGGANGIGHAIAKQFVSDGASVALLDVDPAIKDIAAEMLPPRNATVLGLQVDVCDYETVKTSSRTIRERLSSWHHVVYAAGAGSGKYGFPFSR